MIAPDWQEHEDVVAGTLLTVGTMLYGWGLPLEKALKGMRLAYEMAAKKKPPDSSMPKP